MSLKRGNWTVIVADVVAEGAANGRRNWIKYTISVFVPARQSTGGRGWFNGFFRRSTPTPLSGSRPRSQPTGHAFRGVFWIRPTLWISILRAILYSSAASATTTASPPVMVERRESHHEAYAD